MRVSRTAGSLLLLLAACAPSRPDHFYILSVQPPGAGETRATPVTEAALRVTLPAVVDRAEMVLNTSTDGVVVSEHERWAAPLPDLATQTLARDLERRRSDLVVAAGNSSIAPVIKISIDVVQVAVRKGGQASLEVHWRILDSRSGKDTVGGEVFSAPMGDDGYAAVAQALSVCLGSLADRLIAQL